MEYILEHRQRGGYNLQLEETQKQSSIRTVPYTRFLCDKFFSHAVAGLAKGHGQRPQAHDYTSGSAGGPWPVGGTGLRLDPLERARGRQSGRENKRTQFHL